MLSEISETSNTYVKTASKTPKTLNEYWVIKYAIKS